jgi:hypothetical protein
MPPRALSQLAKQINAEHLKTQTAASSGLKYVRVAGDLLLQARGQCPRGSWPGWLRENIAFSARTARGYMRIARNWSALQAKARVRAPLTLEDGLRLLTGVPSTPIRNTPKAKARRPRKGK